MQKDKQGRRRGTLLESERPTRHFSSNGNEAWFYAGRGRFYFLSTFADGPTRTIVVPTKMIIKALEEIKRDSGAGG